MRSRLCQHSSLAGDFIVGVEPVNGGFNALLKRGELVVRKVLPELGVGGGLLELAIRLGVVEDEVLLVVEGPRDSPGDLLDGVLVLLVDGEDDGLDLLVLAEHPDEELTEVDAVDELAERFAGAPDDEGLVVLLGEVALVDEAGDDVAALDVEGVVGAVDVGGDDGGELAAVLLVVEAVEDLDHPLGVGVALVAEVRRAVVDHLLGDGIAGLVGEDAGGEAGDELLDLRMAQSGDGVPCGCGTAPGRSCS